MSSEFERRLREGREALPDPDAAVTERAWERALAAIRRRGRHARVATVIGVAFVAVLGLGIGLGALIAPSGTAAGGPNGVGFLPESGWFVLQSGPRSVAGQPAVAIAANVPFHPDDDVRGLADSSALPYATLQTLPPGGVVIAAAFSPRGENPFADPFFSRKSLPLDVRDAVATRYGKALRDGEPLGQYELRAAVDKHNVDLNIYFGLERPSRAQLAEAQRQLSGLVVRSSPEQAADRIRVAQSGVSRVIDRTVVCSIAQGNPREIDVQASSGTRLFEDRSRWAIRANVAFHDPKAYPGASASVSAGWPPLDAESLTHSPRCRPSSARVPLSTRGLTGATASPTGDDYDCVVPQKIHVRVKGVFRLPTSLRLTTRFRQRLWTARGAVIEGALAVRTSDGRPIALATVSASGKAQVFVGDSCGPSA